VLSVRRKADRRDVNGRPASRQAPAPLEPTTVEASTGLPDLSSELTVFVSTVGAASFTACIEHLDRQDCRFRRVVIARVAPMSVAFQRMLDTCETPYYIQVDEDMLLRPDAVRRLHGLIRDADADVAMVCAWLWDVHLGRGIQGVKAYRHAIIRKYPYVNVESCEKDQLRRLQADGFRYLRPLDAVPTEFGPWTLGRHGAHYNPQLIFERYSTLEHKRCQAPDSSAWFADHGAEFLARFRDDPSEVNLMALLGILAGRLSGRTPRGEKDFRQYDTLPGWREAQAFFLALTEQTDAGTGVPGRRADDATGPDDAPSSPHPLHATHP
jgi:hypothetical protein